MHFDFNRGIGLPFDANFGIFPQNSHFYSINQKSEMKSAIANDGQPKKVQFHIIMNIVADGHDAVIAIAFRIKKRRKKRMMCILIVAPDSIPTQLAINI